MFDALKEQGKAGAKGVSSFLEKYMADKYEQDIRNKTPNIRPQGPGVRPEQLTRDARPQANPTAARRVVTRQAAQAVTVKSEVAVRIDLGPGVKDSFTATVENKDQNQTVGVRNPSAGEGPVRGY